MAQRPVALITGASAGLGEQFATLFARDGFDVVLTARNTARLEAVAERLRHHQAKTYLISEDLSKPGAAQRLFMFTRSDTIYGGSNQIQRNIIGERALGLPPEPKV